MMTPEHQASSSQLGMEITSRCTGSNNWPKGKWQGSPGNTFQGRPHSLQRYTPLQCQDKKTSWDWSTPCLGGFGCCSPDPQPTMGRYSNMSKSPMTGEWLERSFDSTSLNIIYVTSASKLPILRPKPKEYHRLSQRRRGGWSSPISTTSCRISVSSQGLSLKEGEITSDTTSSGMAWTPSR
jgi:hypothetical protein